MHFPPAAFALLLAITIQGGHGTVEQMIHAKLVEEAGAFCAAHTGEVTPELSELFTLNCQ